MAYKVSSFLFVLLFSILGFSQTKFPTNTATLGQSTPVNKDFIFDIGLGSANPRFRASTSSQVMQLSNDGVVFNPILTGASLIYQFTFSLEGFYADAIQTSANDQGIRFIAPFDLQINSVCMYVKFKGTIGTTTLDLKRASKAAPNTFATIFSTSPAATITITDGEYKCTGDTGTGWTIPVMSPNPFLMDEHDTLRLDVLGVMPGSSDVGLVIIYQPQ